MIRNIIFDLGNVLIHFDRELFMDRAGITDPEDRKLIINEEYMSVEWVQMDRGTLSEEEGIASMCTRLPERLHAAAGRLVQEWDSPIIPMEGMAELVRTLRQNGYGIYLLSNATKRANEYFQRVPGRECFDGVLISADEKLVKPQPEIYRLLCERFSLIPEECVFVDDTAPNAEGAIYCGMKAAVFRGDAAGLAEKLRNLGVNI